MASIDLSPPPKKDQDKFDSWMYRLWTKIRSSLTTADVSATAPIVISTGVGTLGFSHSTSGVTPGTYGGASSVPQVVVNTYGHVTSVSTFAIAQTTSGTAITGANLTLTPPLIFPSGTGTNVLLRAASIAHATSGATPGTYGGTAGVPQFVVDTYGHVSSVSSVPPKMGQNVQNGNYTFGTVDIGGMIYRAGTATGVATWTVPSTLGTGALLSVINDGTGNVTVTAVGTLVFAGTGATGNRTLPRYGMASIYAVGTSRWFISGAGVS